MTVKSVGQSETNLKSAKPARRHDIDWLRVIAVLLLFYVHPGKVFYKWGPWYIQNPERSLPISWLLQFIELWHMQLFFMLAGAAAWFALRKRSGGQFLKERFVRLLVPLIFGILVIVPPQIYIEKWANSGYRASYWEYFPRYFDPQFTQGFDMGHLWFIAYLFGFSLLALPVFLYLRSDSGRRLLDRLAGFLSHPAAFFLLMVPIGIADYLMLDFYPNPLYFITFFLYGFLILADSRFEEVIARLKAPALLLSIGLYAVWIGQVMAGNIAYNWLAPVPRTLITWFCLIAVLGYGKQLLTFSNRFLRYANEASYPVYILHQTVIVALAYLIVRWPVGVGLKFVTLVLSSLAITTLLYEIFAARTNATRFLFGMRLKKKSPQAQTPAPTTPAPTV